MLKLYDRVSDFGVQYLRQDLIIPIGKPCSEMSKRCPPLRVNHVAMPPKLEYCSSSRTECPILESVLAAVNPASPLPMTMTSYSARKSPSANPGPSLETPPVLDDAVHLTRMRVRNPCLLRGQGQEQTLAGASRLNRVIGHRSFGHLSFFIGACGFFERINDVSISWADSSSNTQTCHADVAKAGSSMKTDK